MKDWYVEAVDQVSVEAARLHAALDAVVAMLDEAKGHLEQGMGLREVVLHLAESGGRDVRRSPTTAFAAFEAALTSYRSQVVTALVEQDGMTHTEIAQLIGVSRQMVARLHQAARP
jgi:DNA-directed RNA polymerase specialized sigma24 family protein